MLLMSVCRVREGMASRARRIQFTPSHYFFRSTFNIILLSTSNLPTGHFLSDFQTRIRMHYNLEHTVFCPFI